MLSSLEVARFRCVDEAHLDFDARASGVIGANASGKTSLLEAIYFLAHGRSFRVAQREKLIQHGSASFRIVGRLGPAEHARVAGVQFECGAVDLHFGGQAITSFSEVAGFLPVQIIDPGVHRLIEEGSARRRRMLDWGVFHVKHEFIVGWRRYQRALHQRNAALRGGSSTTVVDAWNSELAIAAQIVDTLRTDYMALFRPCFQTWAERLLGRGADVAYRRGWTPDAPLDDALRGNITRDMRLKTTSIGPHRADLIFTVDGVSARDWVSRGQQKMLASAFVLAQVALRAENSERLTCLLLDDPAAELDVDNLGKLFSALAEIRAQLIITAVSEAGLRGLSPQRMFHVEQGRVRPML